MRRNAFALRGKSRPRKPRIELLEARLLLASGIAMTTPGPATVAAISASYGQLPLSFEPNQGQTDSQVSFLSRGSGYALFLTPNEAVLNLQTPAARTAAGVAASQAAAGDVLQMQLIGANATPSVVGTDQLAGTSNYLIGNDPSQWHTDIPNFARVEENGIYPGVDLVYYGNQRQLEYDFTVAPGADAGVIRLAFQGADSMALDNEGNLVLHSAGGDVVEQAPVLYQEISDTRQAVAGHYVMEENGQVGFAVGTYDRTQPLVIDPTLSYSTYLGGEGIDAGESIAVDSAGDAYVTGITRSTDFPTANPLQPANGSGGGQADAFVVKLNPAGSALIYATYLGGSGFDKGSGIAVDSAGDAYVTGATESTDFPTKNPLQPANAPAGSGASNNAFVAKLNPDGSALIYSTYLGGSGGDDAGEGIALDTAGDAYVTGDTNSTDFPTKNPLQPTIGRGGGFLAKLNADGSALVYSTYVGGSATAVAVDSAGDAYITGNTGSAALTTKNPLQPTDGGITNAFVSEYNADGSAPVYSSYLGGSDEDIGRGIAVDAAGDAYVTGQTDSGDFPTKNPLQSALGNQEDVQISDAFVAEIAAGGSALVYSTYLGGNQIDVAFGIAVDAAGDAYVIGTTYSSDFPTKDALQPTLAGAAYEDADAFVAELGAGGSDLVYSTYLGGANYDAGSGIAVDAAGDAYVTGLTISSDFPTDNALQPTNAGGFNGNAFITKIAPAQATTTVATTTLLGSSPNPSTVGQAVTFTATVTVPQGAGVATGTVTFLEGTAVLGVGKLNEADIATFSTSDLAAGDHTITASYGEDASFAASSSDPIVVTINEPVPSLTTTTLTGSLSTAVLGQHVSFTAIVGPRDTSTELDGSVSFTIDGVTGPAFLFAVGRRPGGRLVHQLDACRRYAYRDRVVRRHGSVRPKRFEQCERNDQPTGSHTTPSATPTPTSVSTSPNMVTGPAVAADGPRIRTSSGSALIPSRPSWSSLSIRGWMLPAPVENAANYKIVSIGPVDPWARLAIKRIGYDAVARTVTLRPYRNA